MLTPPRVYLYLDTVARCGSIRRAADQLHVASTALNRKILEVEAQVGTPLFERLPRGVRLTAAGELLIATIRRSLADLDAAAAQMAQLRGLVRGCVRVASAESVATDFLPGTIGRYQAAHRGVQFHVAIGGTCELIDTLTRDEADLLLAHDPPASPLLQELAVAPQPFCAMMRPGHPLAARRTLRLADCQPYPVALGPESFRSRRLIEAIAARNRLQLSVMLEASTVETLKGFVRQTDGICFQFHAGTLRETSQGTLTAVPLSDPELALGRLVLASRRGRALAPAAAAFAEHLKGAMAGLQGPLTLVA
ncbi:DNA-binding transcriptional LysR family regulator [Cupriavidus gilardii J11]|uniref:DNA-binding transcriptional LysR family regulator n=1 Tax=Cupriavidus gilardii J11 TaxID=936133 RepID=A0A562BQ10_9BURK|nr:LysR family transcriptional regulator [Cupriavidus gilardii]TWG87251.1 DNA-binding transcriptional LysR family regulator [Cupriavidus gilardii J11]